MKMPASVVLASTPPRSVSTCGGAVGWLGAGAAAGAVAAGWTDAGADWAAGSAGLHAPLKASAAVKTIPAVRPRRATIGYPRSCVSNTLHGGRGRLNTAAR